jgi:hypothetical protein
MIERKLIKLVLERKLVKILYGNSYWYRQPLRGELSEDPTLLVLPLQGSSAPIQIRQRQRVGAIQIRQRQRVGAIQIRHRQRAGAIQIRQRQRAGAIQIRQRQRAGAIQIRQRQRLALYKYDSAMRCPFSSSSIEGRKDACNQLMLRHGTLSRKEERTRPATTLMNVKGSDCKVLPNKQGKSLPHEAIAFHKPRILPVIQSRQQTTSD